MASAKEPRIPEEAGKYMIGHHFVDEETWRAYRYDHWPDYSPIGKLARNTYHFYCAN